MSSLAAIFAGDVHLKDDDPPGWQDFFAFLRGPARAADQLFLLGDVFHAWVGDDDKRELARTAHDELAAVAASGVRLTLLVGNHDFMLGARFSASIGARNCDLRTVEQIAQRRVLLMHGDELCTSDRKYQSRRRIWTKRSARAALACLPMRARRELAKRLSAGYGLQDVAQDVKEQLLRVDEQLAAEKLAAAGADVLVHGHTHRPGIQPCGAGLRATVPAWPAAGYAGGWIEMNEDGELAPAGPLGN